MDDTTQEKDAPMSITTINFDRVGAHFQVPEVTIHLNTGQDINDVKHHALVDFGVVDDDGTELRLNGANLKDVTQRRRISVIVFAAAAFYYAGKESDDLVRTETKNETLQVFSNDFGRKANVSRRRELELAVTKAEHFLYFAREYFLSSYLGREINPEADTCLASYASNLPRSY